MTPEERIEKLRECSEQLSVIQKDLEECLRMSGLERRFGHLPGDVADIVRGDDGIDNLINELEYQEEEHPAWTQPFLSPKEGTRKDI